MFEDPIGDPNGWLDLFGDPQSGANTNDLDQSTTWVNITLLCRFLAILDDVKGDAEDDVMVMVMSSDNHHYFLLVSQLSC